MLMRVSLAMLGLVAVPFGTHADSLSDLDAQRLREAIERNWNIPVGLSNVENCTVSLRLHLAADGAVSKVERLDDAGDPDCDTAAESARRAILITQDELGRLPIPADNYNSTL